MTYEEACKLAKKGLRVTRQRLPRNVILKNTEPFDVLDLYGVFSPVTVEDRLADDWNLEQNVDKSRKVW